MITEELRNAQWLCNPDTGLLFPQNGTITERNLIPYQPTDAEMLAGRRLLRVPEITSAEPTVEPEAAPVSTEYTPSLEEAEASTTFPEPADAPAGDAEVAVKRGPGRPKGVVSRVV